jgi:glycosyltransferase involved in cell wall biosynthesis
LEVARALPEEKFLVVGQGLPAELPPNVEVAPFQRDPRILYARTKLLIMPSLVESYGRVAVEAAMSGIPTVARDLPGIREATDNLAVFVGKGDSWPEAVRRTLGSLDEHRVRARELAELRDPRPQLSALRARLSLLTWGS